MPHLRDVYERIRIRRVDLSDGYLHMLHAALQWAPPQDISRIDADEVCRMMRRLIDMGKSVKTVRNYRQAVLFMLGEAGVRIDPRECKAPRNVRRIPTAWTETQLSTLIAACRMAPYRRGWGPEHWEALSLTIYDTSLRIGALLKADVDHLDPHHCTLYIPGECHKGRDDTLQPLHPDTASKLANLPRPNCRLFPWPFNRRLIWKQFGDILRRAGLPDTSRDKFHKLRRTSYTYVAKVHGIAAASDHAAHKGDLSAYYLDKSHLNRPNPLDALPRPK